MNRTKQILFLLITIFAFLSYAMNGKKETQDQDTPLVKADGEQFVICIPPREKRKEQDPTSIAAPGILSGLMKDEKEDHLPSFGKPALMGLTPWLRPGQENEWDFSLLKNCAHHIVEESYTGNGDF